MRIKLSLRKVRSNQLIPINYQYALSSFIYHTIETSDNEYSKWLHEKGFMSEVEKIDSSSYKLELEDKLIKIEFIKTENGYNIESYKVIKASNSKTRIINGCCKSVDKNFLENNLENLYKKYN